MNKTALQSHSNDSKRKEFIRVRRKHFIRGKSYHFDGVNIFDGLAVGKFMSPVDQL